MSSYLVEVTLPDPFDVYRQRLPTFLFLCFVNGVFVDVERIGKPVSNDVYRKYEEVLVDKKGLENRWISCLRK